MLKGLIFSYKAFSFGFLLRSLFVRLFRIKDMEVRQLNIVDELSDRGFVVKSARKGKITVSGFINSTHLDFILRKNTSDLLVFRQVVLQSGYGSLANLIKGCFNSNEIRVVIDAGANIGLTSLYFACLFPNASIYAIEPAPGNVSVLEENFKGKNFKVSAIPKALLPTKGSVRTSNTFRDRGEWATQVIPCNDSSGDIEAFSLTDLKLQIGADVLDVLKMDIEGHEADLFASREFQIELKSVRFIAVEVHEEKADRIEIINILQRVGFRLVYKGETIFGVNERLLYDR